MFYFWEQLGKLCKGESRKEGKDGRREGGGGYEEVNKVLNI